ncbi:adenylyltransferase/cytidyltransferase family protein [Candidatus Rhabdochlamydia sp. T3358]|uniref:adenylyltransferase/cytidyltransferase family protein n=1 Tax=Candidatus Rhabdochlamydia sp. T3358 TaxID=2099795 RepID=UPI0010B01CE2|nr:adenylyltransferase/cytidyltransferase family protein [Candidatus Rhabdochlamydia sp. T3358]VHO04413.1 Bifunctional protein HldE [Candidatus Rhabdochlamydia sp. T3358]
MSRLASNSCFEESVCKKVIEPENLQETIKCLREEKKTIATLNGSFDLLHAGHLEIIFQASLQADILIVALNTDVSIQRYKDVKRPIIPLKQRILLISALEMVDYVTYFNEIDPIQVLLKIRPDVHVNGSEYGQNCIESETVVRQKGRMHIVEKIPGLSTSYIINKIKKICD